MLMQTHGALAGTVAAPISKSDLHRLLIAAALCPPGEPTVIQGLTLSQDIEATAGILRALGAQVEFSENETRITPPSSRSQASILADCGESGSTLRFLVPVLAALGCEATFVGRGRLGQRPMLPLTQQLRLHGVSVENDLLPLTIHGPLTGGEFTFAGDVSSQYITGLLYALPLLKEDSTIRLTSPLQSMGYVKMTLDVLGRFGIQAEELPDGWRIPGGQRYRSPGQLKAEGDWSGAAFWLCAGALGRQPLTVTGLRQDSLQGDRAVCRILSQMGARLCWEGDALTVTGAPLTAVEIDGSQIPDIVPILSVAAALAQGETRIINAQRLRIKESDRLAAMAAGLSALGAQIQETEDGLLLSGKAELRGGAEVDSFGDHRIAMCMAVASTRCAQPVSIRDPMCVAKSYPDFYEDFRRLGGSAHVL